MKTVIRFSLSVVLLAGLAHGAALAASDPSDAPGTKDPALFTRLPGYHIYRAEDIQFDQYEFQTSATKKQVVEGHHLVVLYDPNPGIQQPSPLQIGRNYINAIKAIGGQLVYEYHDPGENVVLKAVKNGAETWAYVEANGNGSYSIHIIEKQSMQQDVVADASALAKGIADAGKVAVYGIRFETDKADIKPGSEPTLREIAKLLQADPKLKLFVVGHSDNVGAFDHNVKLSHERANAVVKALVSTHKIAANRLQAFGAGPVAPAASNRSEDGRAQNRRVELVAQ
jgi:OmpA-OmpF porin, OOP family